MDNYSTPQLLQSETIAWLRFPLVICVVFIHSFGLPDTVNMQEINYFALSGMDIYNSRTKTPFKKRLFIISFTEDSSSGRYGDPVSCHRT
jgi:hypothetical protein